MKMTTKRFSLYIMKIIDINESITVAVLRLTQNCMLFCVSSFVPTTKFKSDCGNQNMGNSHPKHRVIAYFTYTHTYTHTHTHTHTHTSPQQHTCHIHSRRLLGMNDTMTGTTVPCDVPSDDDNRPILEPHGNHVHVLVGTDGHHLRERGRGIVATVFAIQFQFCKLLGDAWSHT